MDIYCPKCGEPWDLDTLHEEVSERWDPVGTGDVYAARFSEVRRDFALKGCGAFYGARCSGVPNRDAAMLSGALFDLLGDDVDGIAAEMEDAGF